MATSAYIHIPFCKSKCKYCSFISYPNIEEKEQYLAVLEKEIRYFYNNEKLKTLYFGGGTPSVLSIKELEKLLNLFKFDKNTEITLELNPENITNEYLKNLKELGINRLSIGCQTFDDEILKIIGRRHNSKDVKNTVENAQKAGFKNISLDFIYGLPNQTIDGFSHDLITAKSLNIQHISLYGLKIDENCYFHRCPPENLPDDDTQADMYITAIEALKDFQHYEISNFGIPSKHNLNYWNNENYYGFGISAHGYINDVRYSNFEDFNNYFNNPFKHMTETKITMTEQLEEEIFLGFRKVDGINIQNINKKFNIDFEKKYNNIIKKYNDFFIKTSTNYALNSQGILISNTILAEFLS